MWVVSSVGRAADFQSVGRRFESFTTHHFYFEEFPNGSLAQSVEQRTFNPLVEGSNPSRPTIYFTGHYLTGWVVSSVGRAADS